MKPQPGLAFGGRYRLVRQIAVGGMGEVWVAKDESLAREIAIKVLKEEFVGNDDFLNRFRVEARNAASLSHAHIAQLYDYGEQDGSAYLVMELVHGEPMSDLLEREPVLAPSRLLTILAQTSRALHAAHVGGVVHRDIKPGNIIIERSGDVKITDFGVSLATNQIPMTAAGMVMGTAQYLSPEQAIGRPATGASDVYALGIVAYEAIAGNRPFTGKTPVDIAVAHVNEPVPPLPKNTHPELSGVIMRMLAKDPQERPRSAAALAHTFESLNKEISENPWGTAPRKPSMQSGAAVAPVQGTRSANSSAGAGQQRGPQITAPGAQDMDATRVSNRREYQGTRTPIQGSAGHPATVPPVGQVPAPSRSGARAVPARPVGAPAQSGLPSSSAAAGAAGASPRQTSYSSAAKRSQTVSSDVRQRSHSPATGLSGKAGARSDRRQETPQSAQPAPRTGLVGRLKELGPLGLILIAIIVVIMLATLVKGLVSASGEAHTGNTVAQVHSSVQFTSSANIGLETGISRGFGALQESAAQSVKDV